MCLNCDFTIHAAQHHFGWDNSFAPVLRAMPGRSIAFECNDASAGQLTAASTRADVATLDFGLINPVTGPVFVEGAEPGDILKVSIHSFAPSGFGWTANIPGFGLLAEQFTDPALKLWSYDADTLVPALFSDIARVPLKPFVGTIGVALAAPGLHSIVPPRRVGGKIADIHIAAIWISAILPPAPCSICRWRCRERYSPSATPMPLRETARSAARPSRAR
jgi:acetamidase/formamidase